MSPRDWSGDLFKGGLSTIYSLRMGANLRGLFEELQNKDLQ